LVLAGLGIGGIAVAFGAQKTVENVFGSLAIAADQPLRVGDAVKIDDFSGTVERIGLRSTQVRTLDRSLITIPNGKLSDTRVESFAARDRIRFATLVSLAYGTTEAQVRRVLEGIRTGAPGRSEALARRRGREVPRPGSDVPRHRGPVLVCHDRLRRVPRLPAGGPSRDHARGAGGGGASFALPAGAMQVVAAPAAAAPAAPPAQPRGRE
jgi:hypothetical protein